jgi:hypothetical protein
MIISFIILSHKMPYDFASRVRSGDDEEEAAAANVLVGMRETADNSASRKNIKKIPHSKRLLYGN